MIIKSLEVGPIMANCYILGCEKTGDAVVIDPGGDTDKILVLLSQSNLKVKYIINTHGHFDHVSDNKRLKEVTGAEILIHTQDAPMLSQLSENAAMFGLSSDNSPKPDRMLEEGDIITFGDNINIKVLHTPGHTLGGICLAVEDVVIVGDTLFAGSIGRTDLPGGNFDTLISSIKKKLFVLSDNTKVLTGHGPETTIGNEKKHNPFVKG